VLVKDELVLVEDQGILRFQLLELNLDYFVVYEFEVTTYGLHSALANLFQLHLAERV